MHFQAEFSVDQTTLLTPSATPTAPQLRLPAKGPACLLGRVLQRIQPPVGLMFAV